MQRILKINPSINKYNGDLKIFEKNNPEFALNAFFMLKKLIIPHRDGCHYLAV